MHDVNLLIGARVTGARNDATFDRKNPVSGEVASRAAAATVEDAKAAVEAASAAFPRWSALGPQARRTHLLKAADRLEAHTDEFVRLVIDETGGTAEWAGFNVMLAAGMLREAAALTTQIKGEVIPTDVPDNTAMAIRQPCGVVLAMAPWNAPIILGVRSIAVPLACGNTVVFKGSELCPGTHELIARAMHETGMTEGVVNYLTHSPADAPEVVEALIANPAVKRVNFTGSTRVGRKVGELAARNLKPALLELGGKAPLVVLADADLDAAVDAAAFGSFMHQGQICMSTERLVVDESCADAFVDKFAAKAAALPAGDPAGGGVVLGSLVGPEAAERMRTLIDDAVAKGATVAAGGRMDGTIMQATVIDHVTPGMRLYSEESFGPMVAVIRVSDDDDAVRVANDTEYGLSAAVFSRDVGRALGVARRIESGICHINGPTVHDEPQMPFGGVKASGYGRFGGTASISEFTDLRWITIQTGSRHYPF